MRTFGEELACARERRKLSQIKLSHLADVSARHISFLETGRARPSHAMVLRLAMALGLAEPETAVLVTSAGFFANGHVAPRPAALGEPTAEALAILFTIEGATEFGHAVSMAAKALDRIGLPQFFLGTMAPNGANLASSIKHRHLGHAPVGWMHHYRKQGYGAIDPLICATARQHLPFFWSEIATPRLMADPLVSKMFGEASDFGITNGFVASVRRSDGKVHAVSCMAKAICPDDPRARSIARAIANAILHKADECAIPERALPMRLTDRERSIFMHLLGGTEAGAIANRLKMSHDELDLAVTRLCNSFGTNDAVDAALRARRYGLLPM